MVGIGRWGCPGPWLSSSGSISILISLELPSWKLKKKNPKNKKPKPTTQKGSVFSTFPLIHLSVICLRVCPPTYPSVLLPTLTNGSSTGVQGEGKQGSVEMGGNPLNWAQLLSSKPVWEPSEKSHRGEDISAGSYLTTWWDHTRWWSLIHIF